jgi:hypothetical protein
VATIEGSNSPRASRSRSARDGGPSISPGCDPAPSRRAAGPFTATKLGYRNACLEASRRAATSVRGSVGASFATSSRRATARRRHDASKHLGGAC